MTTKLSKGKACRHDRNSWLIASGYYEWCYVCGALRKMEQMKDINGVYPTSKWVKPTGDKDNNPFSKLSPLPKKKR